MDIFSVLTFIGGLSLFLFGMNYMGQALEKKAGGKLSNLLSEFTANKYMGFLLGLIITVLIQSSSATTVMVVGFVNSGVMTLKQCVGVIIGANVGTTVTAWILSLAGISDTNTFLRLLKPESFAPVAALVGVIMYLFAKKAKKKDTGMILLGFAILLIGLNTASSAVSGLGDEPWFSKLFVMFQNPILGVLAGAILTAIIQSSSASVGILQALCLTGQVTVGAAFPIILGQNIGTCVTALLSCLSAGKNAKRAAVVHLSFNLLGAIMLLALFYPLNAVFHFNIVSKAASPFSIAIIHTLSNLIITAVLLPLSGILEKISCLVVRDGDDEDDDGAIILDERLYINPAIAIEQAREKTTHMAKKSIRDFNTAVGLLDKFDQAAAKKVKKDEERIDKYEDAITGYLVSLSAKELTEKDSRDLTALMRAASGFERLSDYAALLALFAVELDEEEITFSLEAKKELKNIAKAAFEAAQMTADAFIQGESGLIEDIEPLRQVVNELVSDAQREHIERLKKGTCSFKAGQIFSDILNVFERITNHCASLSAALNQLMHGKMQVHGYLRQLRANGSSEYTKSYETYRAKYELN